LPNRSHNAAAAMHRAGTLHQTPRGELTVPPSFSSRNLGFLLLKQKEGGKVFAPARKKNYS